jgi:hypothetical protein
MSHPDYSAQGWQHILVSLDGPVAIVKLNRAKQYGPHHTVPLFCPTYRLKFRISRRNSITLPVVHELVAAYELFDRDDRVRVVVLTADHTAYAFCSGVRDH